MIHSSSRIIISTLCVLLLPGKTLEDESKNINSFNSNLSNYPLGDKQINADYSKRMLHDLSTVLNWVNGNITSLDVSNNYIQKIPSLPVLARLKKLNLKDNNIKIIEERAFSNLPNLEYLDLSFNFLTGLTLRADVLRGNFTSNLYEPLPIKVLLVGFNRITSLNANTFEHLPYLKELHLCGNPLKSAAAYQFNFLQAINSVTTLEVLDLAKTDIPSLDCRNLKKLSLKKLYINGNQFTRVPDSLHFLSSLELIDFNENPMTEINKESFTGLVNLREIVLSGMPNLTSIKAGTFTNLSNLETLKCSYNPELSYIDEEAFSNHPSYGLKNVYLTNNNLRHLPKNLLRWSQLDRLELDGNPWSCDCKSQWLINFENRRNHSIISFNDLICREPPWLNGTPFGMLAHPFGKFMCDEMTRVKHEMVAFKSVSDIVILLAFTALLFFILGIVFIYYLVLVSSKSGLVTDDFCTSNDYEDTTKYIKLKELKCHNDHTKMYMEALVLVLAFAAVECAFLNGVCDICTCSRQKFTDNHENIFVNCTRRPRLAKMMLEISDTPNNSYDLKVSMQHMNLSSLQPTDRFERLNVSELYLDFNYLKVIPSYSFSQYQNLTALSLSHNDIESISEEAFIGLKSLKVLNLSHNALQTFDIRYLQSTTSLFKLDLSYNNIFMISSNDSLKLGSLVHLDVSANKISEFPSSAFKSIAFLTHLNFSRNALKTLSPSALVEQKLLINVDLSHNQLKDLKPDAFGEDNVISDLSLQHNLLSNVSFISKLQRLSSIDLSFNSLVEFRLNDNSSVRYLHIGNNSLTSIESIIKRLPIVEKIDASWNQINKLPKSSGFSLKELVIDDSAIIALQPRPPGIGSLQFLSLSNLKHLVRLPPNSFDGLFNTSNGTCNSLKITNSGLKTIEMSALNNLNLCELDLSGNQLTTLPEHAVDWDRMRKINLQKNPWHCNCEMQKLLNRVVTILYHTEQEMLEELRCASPIYLAGTRLVHWYNRSEASLCVEADPHQVTLISSRSMIVIDLFLGIIVVTLVFTGFYLQRRGIRQRRSKRNRRF
ncbi:toll-like receptor 8 [Nilaparvata lugens]|uniref:toll-like receptor 8 n=1 Tax=Nilaparvata lugens TaxID=108931 RepID=UPI00193D9361|nr:toll-like receptor 8 [Nilaparvata lugens]